MLTVFVSYSHSDGTIASKLAEDLKASGYTVWLDKHELTVGDSVIATLDQALQSADVIVLVLSPDSIESLWVANEWRATLSREISDGRKRLFPVLARDCTIPNLLRDHYYADFRHDYSSGWRSLITAIKGLDVTIAQMSSSQGTVLDRGRTGHITGDVGGFRGGRSLDDVIADLKSAKGFPIRLLLLGRTGVGKSSMINALFGEQVAPPGDWHPTTMQVNEYHKEINGIQVEVTDTPGLCDDLPEVGNDEKYLAQLLGRRRKFDCVLFVTPLNERRMRSDERRAISMITEILGERIWKHAIIVLTHGDTVNARELQIARSERSTLLRSEIGRRTSAQSAGAIPSVVTSTHSRLPDGREWLGELFTVVLQRMKDTAGKAFLIAAAGRIRPAKKQQVGSEPSVACTQPQPITLDEEQQAALTKKVDEWYPGFTVAGAVAGYAVAGEIGAALGAAGGAVVDLFRWLFR